MRTIEIQTLIDITDTKVNRPRSGKQLEHDQFRNFTTLQQCLELRSNIIFDSVPEVEVKDIKDLGFGTAYKGKHKVWTFRFVPERTGAYSQNGQEFGSLVDDINGVPVIQKLTETINIDKAFFELKDKVTTNTIIKATTQGTT